MKYCSKCGSPISDGMAFCMNCGEKVSNTPKQLSTASASKKAPHIKITICVLAVLILSVTAYFIFGTAKTAVPYNIKWGSSYEEVLKKDADASKPSLTKDKKNYTSWGRCDGDILGLPSDASVDITYYFGLDNSLSRVDMWAYNQDDNTDSDTYFQALLNHFSKKYHQDAEYLGEDILKRHSYVWETKSETTALFDCGDFFEISISPVK